MALPPPLPEYPLERKVAQLFAALRETALEQPTDINRDFYLDLAERTVRDCASCQGEDGIVRDQYTSTECATTTGRFVGVLGLLIGAGRRLDLVDAAARSMDLCCESMATGIHDGKPVAGPEFYTKELMYAYRGLKGHVDRERRQRWAELLSSFDPWERYGTCRDRAKHNWPVYAICGEQLKQYERLVEAEAFIDEVLDTQAELVTAEGLYRDPHDPVTYDLTCRQQFGLMPDFGYDGRYREWLDEVCRRGALTQLLFTSTTGQMPFGGRSNQFHHMEGMAACICELEARRYAEMGEMDRAGAMKRAARQAALAIGPWFREDGPTPDIKNRFDPGAAHGYDRRDYYTVYWLLAGSLFATAWHLADDSIPEGPAPADLGGYVLQLWPAFHRTFATCGDYHLEIDTKAQPRHDATGLGRFHRRGVRPETALSAPIPANPVVLMSIPGAERECAIGPVWLDGDGEEHRLAECSERIEEATVNVLREEPDLLSFEVIYRGDLFGAREVVEQYELSADGLRLSVRIEGEVQPVGFTVPLLVTDGTGEGEASPTDRGLDVQYEGHRYTVELLGEAPVAVRLTDERVPNRTGIYRVAELRTDLREAVLRLALR